MAESAMAPAVPSERIRSIDIVRGLACVLMAIDHVRVYSGLPAGGPTAGIFLTRWVTHFVAPVFCFFAGTGAYYLGARLGDPAPLRKFLVTRGLLLVALELTVIRFLWSFNPDLTKFSLAGVIWMLGWCMVLLGLFVGLPAKRVGWIGVGIVVLQQLFNLPPRLIGAIASPWSFIYNSPARSAPFGVNVLFVIVPWVGVMMAGYGFGLLMRRDDDARTRTLTRLGVGMTIAWLVLGVAVALLRSGGGGEAAGNGPKPPFWMMVLNQQKYPASQIFLLMTLGPAIALLPYVEKWRGFAGKALETFGRVPMWYYLMHILLIHTSAIIVNRLRLGSWSNAWFTTAPYTRVPPDGRWTLSLLYLVWAICIMILYPVCMWYAARKRTNPARWMKYI